MARARPHRRSAHRSAALKCPACGHRVDMHVHPEHNRCIICARTGGRCKVIAPPDLFSGAGFDTLP